MSEIAIKVENLSKRYEIGSIGTGSLARDIQGWLARLSGKEDPNKLIELKSSARSSKVHWALKDVSFEIKKGEAVGIIGKNGAGKSTLLKILSRVTTPTSGTVKINGRIASLLEVGTGFHGDLTGRENIFMNGAILGMSRKEIQTKLDEIIDFSGVEKYIDTPVKRYSSGMYVRLAFAVAAYLEPDILVVDEVLAVGDAEFQKKCLGKMNDASKNEGRTVIFVSHNMGAIRNLCNQAILIEDGKLQIKSDSESIIKLYSEKKENYLEQNLLLRTDRNGNGMVKFASVNCLDEKQSLVKKIASGSNLTIKIKLLLNERIDITKLQIDVGISNNYGVKLVWLSTSLSNNKCDITFESEYVYIEFKIDKLPLQPGKYMFMLFSKYVGLITDSVDDAYLLEVVSGDFYGDEIDVFPYGHLLLNHTYMFLK